MRAQHRVALVMPPLRKKMDVEIAEQRRKRIDVVELDGAIRGIDAQAVAEARRIGDGAGEQPRFVNARQFAYHAPALAFDHEDAARLRQQGADADPAASLMHAEIGEGIAVPSLDDRARRGAKHWHARVPAARSRRGPR